MAKKTASPADDGVINRAKQHGLIAGTDAAGCWWFKEKGSDAALNAHGLATNLEAWRWLDDHYGVPDLRKGKSKKPK